MSDWDTNDRDWEDVDVPQGTFISWGNRTGQHVTGEVMSFDPNGGTDYDGGPCPQLEIALTERAASIDKEGNRTDHDPGTLVTLNCGQIQLKRAVRIAALNRGDLVKITLQNLVKSSNGTTKEFGIKVKRGAGQPVESIQQPPKDDPWATPMDPPAGPPPDDEPPF